MDVFLGQVTSQAMNYAIRSGITITTTYAIKQCSNLLREAPRSQAREELMQLQLRLESKIRIISPAIDMIELLSARGNTSLESAVSLTKEIRYQIQRLGKHLSDAAEDERLVKAKAKHAKSRAEAESRLRRIAQDIKNLLARIEDAVPLINLAITTSGANLSSKLSGTISPSRLLQASTFLTAADSKYAAQPGGRVQVGPTYTLTLYMLFAGHARKFVDEASVRNTTWKEVIHKAKVKLVRVPLDELYKFPGENRRAVNGGVVADSIPGDAKTAEFAYQLLVIEDLNDDRMHTFDQDETPPGSFDDVPNAGIRDILPIHEISKVFYADTGKILNIGREDEGNSPVLLVKRDVHAEPPRRMLHRSQMGDGGFYDDSVLEDIDIDSSFGREDKGSNQLRGETISAPSASAQTQAKLTDQWRLPSDLDPEWMAFEVYTEDEENSSNGDSTPPSPTVRDSSPATNLASTLSKFTFRSSTASASSHVRPSPPQHQSPQPIKSSLSLLEMLVKLTALQQFRQESHLAIEDELLNFFLDDSASARATGADGKSARQRLRTDAMRRVGFDPYDESPVKKRGEVYIEAASNGITGARATLTADGTRFHRGLDWSGESRSLDGAIGTSTEMFRDAFSSPPSATFSGFRSRTSTSYHGEEDQINRSPSLPRNPFAQVAAPTSGVKFTSPSPADGHPDSGASNEKPNKLAVRPRLKIACTTGDYEDDCEDDGLDGKDGDCAIHDGDDNTRFTLF